MKNSVPDEHLRTMIVGSIMGALLMLVALLASYSPVPFPQEQGGATTIQGFAQYFLVNCRWLIVVGFALHLVLAFRYWHKLIIGMKNRNN